MSKSTYIKITGVPEELKRNLKAEAARLGVSLSELVLPALERIGVEGPSWLERMWLERKAAAGKVKP